MMAKRIASGTVAARSSAASQKGAALITALLVVTLAAVLVSGLLWRQEVQLRRVENQRQSLQAHWVSAGAFDWTRLILRSEADASPVTYLGGVWSVPIAPTRLSDFLGQIGATSEAEAGSTWMSGDITDAQSRFNLRNLVTNAAGSGGVTVDPTALGQFQKLLSLLGMSTELASPVATQMRLAIMQSDTRLQTAASGNAVTDAANAANAAQSAQSGTSGSGNGSDDAGLAGSSDDGGTRPILMTSLSSLLAIPGFTPGMVERLTPFLTILPTPTPVNVNTASAEVIAASVPALPLSAAQALVHARDRAFFVNVSDATSRIAQLTPVANISTASTASSAGDAQFDVTTSYFWVHGRIQQGRAVVDREALVYRNPRTHTTTVVRMMNAPQSG